MLLAVSAGAVATPEELVSTVAVVAPPANTAPAPLDGAVKVTETPLIGEEVLSNTWA